MLNRYTIYPTNEGKKILYALGDNDYIFAANGIEIDAQDENAARIEANKLFPISNQDINSNYPTTWADSTFATIQLTIPKETVELYIQDLSNAFKAIYAHDSKPEEIWSVKQFFEINKIMINDIEIDSSIPEWTGIDIRIKKYNLNIQHKRIIHPDYKVDTQAKMEESEILKCQSMGDILRLQKITSIQPIFFTQEETYTQIQKKVKDLSLQYKDKCQDLDLLLQVKLDFTYKTSWYPMVDKNLFQARNFQLCGWRSVLFLNTTQAVLIGSTQDASIKKLLANGAF